MKLVICEKNIAAKRIAYILSNGKAKSIRFGKTPVYEFVKDNETWRVVGLKGHIVNIDYPRGFNQWTKIPPRDLIDVEPCKKISEKAIASALKSLVDKNPFLIVATDFDREGELIGVEVVDLLKSYNKDISEIKRARFSAITNYEIKNAFDKLVDVDYNLSNAGEARQVIDLVWGAVLTRFISLTSNRLGKDFLSIGRVQSPTLAILVEREKEIKNFKPKKFWKILARLRKERLFNAEHSLGIFWNEEEANNVYEKIKDSKEATVKKVEKTRLNEPPPAPFNTTSFLQSASSLGFSASKAMNIAEELYMRGLISYPRTDNTVYPRSLNIKAILEKLLKSSFSKEASEVLDKGRGRPTRGRKQTTDHPPIHPVEVPGRKLNPDQERIYELVCRRFLATLAKDAVSEITKVSIDISGEDFKAQGYRLIEPNWKNIYIYVREKRKTLPVLEVGEKVKISSIDLKEDETKPPKRYTQGSLIAKMEQLSLGTKSTRHEIINKLYSRRYITGSPLVPTSTAIAVVDALMDCDVVKPQMTSVLEEDMNAIVEGKKTLQETVKESREMLTEVMKSLEKDRDKIRENIVNALREQNALCTCPMCGKDMVVRVSKKGKRFMGCTGYPECNNTYSLPQKGGLYRANKICDVCNTPMVKIKMRGRKTWNMCLNLECPAKRNKSH
jgi:DNA topoisomerase-1